jgi:hypothetical protein
LRKGEGKRTLTNRSSSAAIYEYAPSASTFGIFQIDAKAIKQTRAASTLVFQIGKT